MDSLILAFTIKPSPPVCFPPPSLCPAVVGVRSAIDRKGNLQHAWMRVEIIIMRSFIFLTNSSPHYMLIMNGKEINNTVGCRRFIYLFFERNKQGVYANIFSTFLFDFLMEEECHLFYPRKIGIKFREYDSDRAWIAS